MAAAKKAPEPAVELPEPTAADLWAAVHRYREASAQVRTANEEHTAARLELREIMGRLGIDRYALGSG